LSVSETDGLKMGIIHKRETFLGNPDLLARYITAIWAVQEHRKS